MSDTRRASEPSPGRGLYCNRTLNLRSIKVIGYDMDYTLVHYRVEDWERRAYRHIRKQLVAAGWQVADLVYDPELVVRGLVVDTERGNFLKVNRFGFVKTACHGTRPMAYDALRQSYVRTMIDLSDRRFRFLNTLFDLSEGCLYAQLVDRLDEGKLPAEAKGYLDLHRRVRANVDAAHTEGELKAEIINDPDRFVVLDEDTPLALLDQKRAGKKLMLISNSEWPYTNAMMSYAFDRFLPSGMTWRELFELTVIAARKPSFFESDAPLLKVVDDAGLLAPQVGPLEAHGCYFGGNAARIESHLGLSGDEILYLGDHMYGDVHVSKRVLLWRTGLILRELEAELAAVDQGREDQRRIGKLMAEKEALERQQRELRLAQQRRKGGYGPEVTRSASSISRQLGTLRSELTALDERIAPIAVRAATLHNARWGLLMRAGNDKSLLASRIERDADVYTSRVSNLLDATPFAYLRPPRSSLPHDPIQSPVGEQG
jgi:5'-nucleotidase